MVFWFTPVTCFFVCVQAYKALSEEYHHWVLGAPKAIADASSFDTSSGLPQSDLHDSAMAFSQSDANDAYLSDVDLVPDPVHCIRSRALEQWPELFESQLNSLHTMDDAHAICRAQNRIATAAVRFGRHVVVLSPNTHCRLFVQIVTPTGSGKDMLPLVWARLHGAVSIMFVPYRYLHISYYPCYWLTFELKAPCGDRSDICPPSRVSRWDIHCCEGHQWLECRCSCMCLRARSSSKQYYNLDQILPWYTSFRLWLLFKIWTEASV